MWNTIIFRPLYNLLVAIMDFLPAINVGLAAIIFTVIIRLILFPLSKNSLITQLKMKEVEGDAARIRAEYKNDRQVQATKIMELYKSRGIKPFSGILLLIVQLPILLALVSVFYHIIPTIDPALLYSFIHVPAAKPTLFGLDLTHKSLILAVATGVIQFLQLHFSLAYRQAKDQVITKTSDASTKLASSMGKQMKYLVPIFAFISIYWLVPARFPEASSIVAIYWSISALFTLGQELYIKKRHLKM